LGYHFVIGNGTETPDGAIEAGVRWHQQKHGAHCKTPGNYFNDHGIGICLVGDFTKSRPTKKQLRALDELVVFLSRSCSIPADRVTTHGHINHKTKCPGKYFALEPVRRHLAQGPASRTSGTTSLASQRRRRELGAR
jgi:N-acetyl-anhydromuramyl-L-alanine amidase AmpD